MQKLNLEKLVDAINAMETPNKARAKRNGIYVNGVSIDLHGNEAYYNSTRVHFKSVHQLIDTLRRDYVLSCTAKELESFKVKSITNNNKSIIKCQ